MKVNGPNAAAPFVENRASVQFNGQDIGTATAGIPAADARRATSGRPGGRRGSGAGSRQPAAGPAGPVSPASPSDQNAGGGGGKTEAGPLTIEKTAAVTTCDAATPCSFDIKVSNTSGTEILGPITIAETPPAGAKLAPRRRRGSASVQGARRARARTPTPRA